MTMVTIPAMVKAIEALQKRVSVLENIHAKRNDAPVELSPAVIRRGRPPRAKENKYGETTI